MTEQAYEEFVVGRFDEAFRTGNAIIFTNRGTTHARSVLGQIVSRSQKSLDIFSGCLSLSVYDPELLNLAVQRAVSIRIVVGDSLPLGQSALSNLKNGIEAGIICVKHFNPSITLQGQKHVLDHFAMGDGKHVRAEENASSRSATVILNADTENAKNIARAYQKVFEYMWARGAPWHMPERA